MNCRHLLTWREKRKEKNISSIFSLFSPYECTANQMYSKLQQMYSKLQGILRGINTGAECQISANICPGKGTQSF